MASQESSKSALMNILNGEPSTAERGPAPPLGAADVGAVASLKRAASPAFEEGTSRKRLKESSSEHGQSVTLDEKRHGDRVIDGRALAHDLAQELQCGCCSELVYKPVIVAPCQHFFCGSCCTLWIKNGGTNCPACRGVSTSVIPSRALQSMVDVLIRAAPHKARTERERLQADEVYPSGRSLRIPTPKEPSPEPNIAQSGDFARPCPHCLPGNPFGWRCPNPIPDPNTDVESAWHLDDGTPPGHGYCGNCEVLLALQAPTTTKCDLCQVSFCGINVQGRCSAISLPSQQPHGMTDIGDLIQSAAVYECFDSNTVEVEIMLDYMTVQRLTPRHVYREVVAHIMNMPRGFTALIELDLFADIHAVGGGVDPDPNGPRSRICRWCAAEVLLWGLRDWWVRERRKGFLDESVTSRKDCPEGSDCRTQTDLAHAKEFNHIIVPPAEPIAFSSLPVVPAGLRPSAERHPTSLPSLAELGITVSAFSRSQGESSSSAGSSSAEREQSSSQAAVEEQLVVAAQPIDGDASADQGNEHAGPMGATPGDGASMRSVTFAVTHPPARPDEPGPSKAFHLTAGESHDKNLSQTLREDIEALGVDRSQLASFIDYDSP